MLAQSINRNREFGTRSHFRLSPSHMLPEKLGLHPASFCFSRAETSHTAVSLEKSQRGQGSPRQVNKGCSAPMLRTSKVTGGMRGGGGGGVSCRKPESSQGTPPQPEGNAKLFWALLRAAERRVLLLPAPAGGSCAR